MAPPRRTHLLRRPRPAAAGPHLLRRPALPDRGVYVLALAGGRY